MQPSMNVPYVKKFDVNGTLTNRIKGHFFSEFPNRKERREDLNKQPLYGNGKNFHLTVVKTAKFKRVRQIEFEMDGTRKVIEHYLSN